MDNHIFFYCFAVSFYLYHKMETRTYRHIYTIPAFVSLCLCYIYLDTSTLTVHDVIKYLYFLCLKNDWFESVMWILTLTVYFMTRGRLIFCPVSNRNRLLEHWAVLAEKHYIELLHVVHSSSNMSLQSCNFNG